MHIVFTYFAYCVYCFNQEIMIECFHQVMNNILKLIQVINTVLWDLVSLNKQYVKFVNIYSPLYPKHRKIHIQNHIIILHIQII